MAAQQRQHMSMSASSSLVTSLSNSREGSPDRGSGLPEGVGDGDVRGGVHRDDGDAVVAGREIRAGRELAAAVEPERVRHHLLLSGNSSAGGGGGAVPPRQPHPASELPTAAVASLQDTRQQRPRERGPMVEPSKSGGGAALRRAAAGVALPVGVVYVIEGQEPAPLLFSTGAALPDLRPPESEPLRILSVACLWGKVGYGGATCFLFTSDAKIVHLKLLIHFA
uniref:p0028E10.4 protein n=1 Tax=Oryza sativa subsp. japonica TaxID=39947 RepID=Q9AS87_ORYSJ|nr:P0028E10.4 [Oryza sativa Japonica Group]